LMQQAALAANEAATLEDAARIVLKHVCRHTGWPLGHLCLVRADRRVVLPSALWHVDGLPDRYERFRRISEEISFAKGEGLPGRVLREAAPVWVVDVDREDRRCRLVHAAAAGIKAAFGFPVLVGTEVVAVLEFFSHSRATPNQTLLEVMGSVGTQLGRVVERQRAEEAALRSDQHLRLLTESAMDAILTINAIIRDITVSREAQRTLRAAATMSTALSAGHGAKAGLARISNFLHGLI
jgi:GAF domain-containing protein